MGGDIGLHTFVHATVHLELVRPATSVTWHVIFNPIPDIQNDVTHNPK